MSFLTVLKEKKTLHVYRYLGTKQSSHICFSKNSNATANYSKLKCAFRVRMSVWFHSLVASCWKTQPHKTNWVRDRRFYNLKFLTSKALWINLLITLCKAHPLPLSIARFPVVSSILQTMWASSLRKRREKQLSPIVWAAVPIFNHQLSILNTAP